MIVSNGYRKYGFDAFAGKVLKKSDMRYWMNSPQRIDPDGVAFELGDDVIEVEPDFFEIVPTIDELWIINPECNINMTDKTLKLFLKNKVIMRGKYDTAAEKYAREYNLRFLHLDVVLASVGDFYERSGIDIITLRFNSDGSPYIHQDCRCQGSSAGNVGGGEISFDLPKKFYLNMTADEIADRCWHSETIKENGILKEFIDMAKKKNGYFLDFKK